MTDIKGKDATLQIRNPLLLNDYVFSVSGSWPLRRVYWRYTIVVIGISLHILMQLWDLYDWLGNIDMMVNNVVETTVTIASYLCLILLPINKNLKKLLIAMNQEVKENLLSENEHERRLYQAYNSVSYLFTKYGVITTSTIISMLLLHPVIDVIKLQYGYWTERVNWRFYPVTVTYPNHPSVCFILSMICLSEVENVTQFRVLPMRGHIFVDYSDFRVYCLIYAFQCIMFYVAVFHTNEVSLQVNMVLHLCANLSILSYRIRKIRTKPVSDFNADIKKAVMRHRELIQMSYSLNEIFDVIVAMELTQSNVRLALTVYMIMINLHSDTLAVFNFLIMFLAVMAVLYLYSYAGEQLMYESTRVGDAFYDIDWIKITNEDRRTLLICMLNGQRMLRVTAGKCYTFSLFGFTGIVKTAFAFVSMLQAMM